ncbi:hypothetical protein [Cystobacter fuscus]|uniref:hypothetical protein n=1 Tax=Cystobacter fuscus TaxID=43 RepID=UPI0037BE82D5
MRCCLKARGGAALARRPASSEPPELSRIVHLLCRWPRERLALLRKLLDVADLELGQ